MASTHVTWTQPLDSELLSADLLEDPLYDSVSFDDSVVDSHSPSSTPSAHHPSPDLAIASINKHPMRYAFSQVFGETFYDPHSFITYADIISTVRISPDSEMIAAGDMAGRIAILSRNSSRSQRHRTPRYPSDVSGAKWLPVGRANISCDFESVCSDDFDDYESHRTTAVPERPCYDFSLQFAAQDTSVDLLYNTSRFETITALCWGQPTAGSQILASSTGATVKVWRIYEKKITRLLSSKPPRESPRHAVARRRPPSMPWRKRMQLPCQSPPSFPPESKNVNRSSLPHHSFLKFPRLEIQRFSTTATAKDVYESWLDSINSLSLNSDGRALLIADDTRIEFMSLENCKSILTILMLGESPVVKGSEQIVAALCHPRDCNLVAYANTDHAVKVFDLRESATLRRCTSKYEERIPDRKRSSFFSTMASSISDVKFSRHGPLMLTRDYMNLRLWDMRMERVPILRIPVHENLRSRMCDLFQNDCFYDKFDCCFSSDGGSLLTGSYNGIFQAFSAEDGSCSATEANLDTISGLSGRQQFSPVGLSASLHANASVEELVDPTKRVLTMDASQDEDIAAVAAGPGIYIYQGVTSGMSEIHGTTED